MQIVKMLTATILGLATIDAAAQGYPVKPIVFISSVGGAGEAILRTTFEQVRQNTGATLIFEARPGGDGVPALNALRIAAPDGHTLGVTYASAMNVSPLINPQAGIDPLKDFIPVTTLWRTSIVFAAREDSPARDLRDIVGMARAKPGTVRIGGVGAGARLWVARLEERSGATFLQIPYKAGGELAPALYGGHIDVFLDTSGTVIGQKGRTKILSYGLPVRSPLLPNVPTLREMYQFDTYSWNAILAPLGTPSTAVNWVQRELVRALKSPEISKSLEVLNYVMVGDSSEEFSRNLSAEINENREILRKYPDIR